MPVAGVDAIHKLHYPEVSARRLNVCVNGSPEDGRFPRPVWPRWDFRCRRPDVFSLCRDCQFTLAVEALRPGRGPLPARLFGIQPARTVKRKGRLFTPVLRPTIPVGGLAALRRGVRPGCALFEAFAPAPAPCPRPPPEAAP